MDKKYTPKAILDILHSIVNLSVQDGELDTWFKGDPLVHTIQSFKSNSFTKELLELIENHLLESMEEDKDNHEEGS